VSERQIVLMARVGCLLCGGGGLRDVRIAPGVVNPEDRPGMLLRDWDQLSASEREEHRLKEAEGVSLRVLCECVTG
jgi:hypothetical protein